MTKIKNDSIIIKDRYQIFSDGVIYDLNRGEEIPQWIFEFRDFVLKNYKKMT